ncbi:MAG: tetratricopeptide repeat protein [Opitutales bacterium]|jgi:hypothetical protein
MNKDQKDPQKPEIPVGLNSESDLPPDADVEERFNDFWKRNGASVFGGIAIGAVIVIGIQLFQYFDQKKEDAVREAFAAAGSVELKLQFVEENPNHQLAALAQLQIADGRYQAGEHKEAADLYGSSAKVFEDGTLVSRALLGQGMSLIQSGSLESGRAVLKTIALDGSALDQTRGEAAYNLAISHLEAGDTESALEMIDVILQLDGAPFWVYRANLLRDRLN